MRSVREDIGGLGNLLFKEAYLWGQVRDGVIPDQYVQSYKYWEKYREELRVRFGAGIKPLDRVAIHIRRGDYLKVSQFHANMWDEGYYKEAIKQFPKDTRFLVFCKDNQNPEQDKDDQEWLKDNLPLLDIDYEIHDHGTEVEDLNTMAGCQGLIGANSSFSWWAAFLGDPKRSVVMPREDRWFVDGIIRTELLPEWTQV